MEQLELGENAWARIASVWAELATCPVNEPDVALDHLMLMLRELTSGQCSLCVIAEKTEPHTDRRPDPLHGWRPTRVIHREGVRDPSFATLWSKDPNNVLYNKKLQHMTAEAGTHRTYMRSDIFGDRPWSETRAEPLFRYYNIRDRMTAAYALSNEIEVYFTVDRLGDEPEFEETDRDILRATLLGVGPICLRLAMSYGLLESHMRLTPRERETLIYLLDSQTEKEIAAAMGLTPRSAHQNVVSVFRKLNVNSRAQLMSMWMSPPSVPSPKKSIANA